MSDIIESLPDTDVIKADVALITPAQKKAELAAKIRELMNEARAIEDPRSKRALNKVIVLMGIAEDTLRTHRKPNKDIPK